MVETTPNVDKESIQQVQKINSTEPVIGKKPSTLAAPQQDLEEDDYSEDEEYSEDNEDNEDGDEASEEKKFPVKSQPQPMAKNMISPPSIANL